MIAVLRTLSQILTAGIAITAFSLLLYALTFNLRHGVMRAFALILVWVVLIFTAESMGGTAAQLWMAEIWQRIEWVGIVFLPAAYFQISDALLATTGKPSQGRRWWMMRLLYLLSALFLFSLAAGWLVGPISAEQLPAPHLQATRLTDVFVLYYLAVMGMSAYNMVRAYRRTVTTTSRRRMGYLLIGSVAPALGSFPFLLFGSQLAARHAGFFWLSALLANLVTGFLLVVMAYAVAFFDAFWPDRVVKVRLFKWIMRGPVTASLALAFTTIVRRAGEMLGTPYSAFVPIVMVGTVVLCEFLITMFAPLGERLLFAEGEDKDLRMVRQLQDRLLTRNDLRQFLELVLAAVCDRLQAAGAYIIALNGTVELVVTVGKSRLSQDSLPDELVQQVLCKDCDMRRFEWGEDLLLPLHDAENGQLLGVLGVTQAANVHLDGTQQQDLDLLARRAAMALRDRHMQKEIFGLLETLAPQVEFIQRLGAASRYDQQDLLREEPALAEEADMVQWVKDALGHYWGGPRLTESPLMRLQSVQAALQEHDGNPSNALRAILRQAIERVRPEGERRFTGEWILYNILEMKFLEGKKVREIAMRLAMSEADLYRKQRVAIEAVTKAIVEMEEQALSQKVGDE